MSSPFDKVVGRGLSLAQQLDRAQEDVASAHEELRLTHEAMAGKDKALREKFLAKEQEQRIKLQKEQQKLERVIAERDRVIAVERHNDKQRIIELEDRVEELLPFSDFTNPLRWHPTSFVGEPFVVGQTTFLSEEGGILAAGHTEVKVYYKRDGFGEPVIMSLDMLQELLAIKDYTYSREPGSLSRQQVLTKTKDKLVAAGFSKKGSRRIVNAAVSGDLISTPDEYEQWKKELAKEREEADRLYPDRY